MLRPLKENINVFSILANWPKDALRLVFRLSGGWVCIALEADLTSAARFLELSFNGRKIAKQQHEPGFCRGFVHLSPYGAYGLHPAFEDQPITYHIKASLLVHEASGKSFLCADNIETALSKYAELMAVRPSREEPTWVASLVPQTSDAAYLETIRKILRDVEHGRYYQLNFLRYFDCVISANAAGYAKKFIAHGGAAAFWFDDGEQSIFSLSPERFLTGSGNAVATYPIKGTAVTALTAGDTLLTSAKDRAELNMIIDLMRNDLGRVSDSGSVNVLEHQGLMSAEGVVHLFGQVTARLRDDLRMQALLKAVCPGGSITGAPKQEVMKAISTYEQRRRSFFMGNVFYFDPERLELDANILIRTVVRSGSICEYAAGSGVGVKSSPLAELSEVHAKCTVLLKQV